MANAEQISPSISITTAATPNEQASTDVFKSGVEALHTHLAKIDERIARMQADSEMQSSHALSQTRIIDTLHAELQGYRDDLVLKILRPLVVDLIALYDDIKRLDVPELRSALADQPISARFLSDVQLIPADIEEILVRYGFEAFEQPDDQFSSSVQRVLQIVKTNQPDLDKRVATHVRKGFRYDNRIIRPELVTVYRFEAAIADA